MKDQFTLLGHSKIEFETKKIGNFDLSEFTFSGHNVLKTSLLHNGSEYGNSGNGPIVKIKFENLACTQMFLNGQEVEEFVIEFRCISERDQLATALKLIVKELEK